MSRALAGDPRRQSVARGGRDGHGRSGRSGQRLAIDRQERRGDVTLDEAVTEIDRKLESVSTRSP